MLSVVVAAHNEEACLPELVARLDRAIARARCPAEIILVDDGSTDASFRVIERLAATDPRIRGVRLARNEGHQAALLCGMSFARGGAVVTLDADLQHPPELLPAMIAAWRRGHDVVHMRRLASPSRGALREALAAAFYRLYNALSDVRVLPGSTDFRLLDRACVDELLARRAALPRGFLRAAARTVGLRHAEIEFASLPRYAGTSSYTLQKLFALGVGAVFSSTRLAPRRALRRAAERLSSEEPGRPAYSIEETVGAGFGSHPVEALNKTVVPAPLGAPLR